jgi:selenide,water dikinase
LVVVHKSTFNIILIEVLTLNFVADQVYRYGVAMKDMEKRKRVMARSMRLGHCICDHKKACPCDILREKDVCPCAGERLDGHTGPVRLMNLVESAGCASKIDEATLKRVLHGLPFLDDPRVLVGAPAGDDAGIYKIDDGMALVQTVDVFTPSVDDPYVFGQIAAANSLSDVYAMGGRPITALSIVGFPIRTMPDDAMHLILRGGIDKMSEAGVAVVGGHSINDKEIKAGFAVTGLVHPDKIVTNAGARPGDRLILTKPLGTGIMAFAAQIGRTPAGGSEAAARSMAMLNCTASKLMIEFGAHACTDVTGFGLMGHLAAMVAASKVDVEIIWDDLPLLPGILQCLADGIASGAVERNRESSGHCLTADENVQPAMLDLCFDPQTSGGLLIAVGQDAANDLLERLHADGVSDAVIIGKVLDSGSGRVFVCTNGRRQLPTSRPLVRESAAVAARNTSIEDRPIKQETSNMSCCEGNHGSEHSAVSETGGVAAIQQKFQEFLQTAFAPGALDGKTKEAIAIALSVLAKCEPCVKSHVKKAREMGFSQEEIDDAAWMGIAFGGAPTMAFYNRVRKL